MVDMLIITLVKPPLNPSASVWLLNLLFGASVVQTVGPSFVQVHQTAQAIIVFAAVFWAGNSISDGLQSNLSRSEIEFDFVCFFCFFPLGAKWFYMFRLKEE